MSNNKRAECRPGFPLELRVDINQEIRDGLDTMKNESDRPIATYVRKVLRKALLEEGYIPQAQEPQP